MAKFSDDATTIQELKDLVIQFSKERHWQRHHAPKNLAMGIAIEAAELMEHYQWERAGAPDMNEVADELADVLFNVLNFAYKENIDLSSSFIKKYKKLQKKYPLEQFNKDHDDLGEYRAIKKAYREGEAVSKPFAVFDIDGTLIRWQLYHAITDSLARQGEFDPDTYQEIRAARMQWKKREEPFKAYEQRLVSGYENLLGHLSVKQFETAAQNVFEEYKDQVYVYTRDLSKQLKAAGYLLFAVSGSQQEIIERIASYYDFDDCVGTVFERQGDHFTGVKRTTVGRKAEALRELVTKHHSSYENSVAVGDSLSDVAMLELVERPIAFNPEQALFEHAQAQGWQVVIERKNVIYELEPGNGSYQLKG